MRIYYNIFGVHGELEYMYLEPHHSSQYSICNNCIHALVLTIRLTCTCIQRAIAPGTQVPRKKKTPIAILYNKHTLSLVHAGRWEVGFGASVKLVATRGKNTLVDKTVVWSFKVLFIYVSVLRYWHSLRSRVVVTMRNPPTHIVCLIATLVMGIEPVEVTYLGGQTGGQTELSSRQRHGTTTSLQARKATEYMHGNVVDLAEEAEAFSQNAVRNKSMDVTLCTAAVDRQLTSYQADGSGEFASVKLEIWCNVYNVHVAEVAMMHNPAKAVLFQETKSLWKKVWSHVKVSFGPTRQSVK